MTDDSATDFIEPFEGFSTTPYLDPARVWTIGFGSTRDASGNPVTADTAAVTRDEATGLLRRDLTRAAMEVSSDVHVPLTQNERVALEDFIYNVGAGNFRASTLLRELNAGRYDLAAAQFDLWDHAGGVVLAGLLRRREAERAEFLKPTQGTSA